MKEEKNDEHAITCGSVVKIQHKETKYFLNSEDKQLGAGSGQQIVTFIKEPDSSNALWWLRPQDHRSDLEYPEESSCKLAEPIRCGSTIRITHSDTVRNLHSHDVESVLSRQQEVSCFGSGYGKGDGGDNWKVECANPASKYWKRNTGVRLKHVDTGKYIGTAKKLEFNTETCGHNCPIMGHLEAFCRASSDSYTLLSVEQGVHLSR